MNRRHEFTTTQIATMAGVTRDAVAKARPRHFPKSQKCHATLMWFHPRSEVKEYLARKGIDILEAEYEMNEAQKR